MQRIITPIILFLGITLSCISHAAKRYQIDVILFTHQSTTLPADSSAALLSPNTRLAINLQTNENATGLYRILPNSSSQLRNQYWALNRNPAYQVLAHYSWIQPGNNQRPVAFSASANNGWSVEGTLRIRQSNYYLLDTDLLFSANNNARTAFNFSQKQRLKGGTVYYLDHPQAGMLIKVHALS